MASRRRERWKITTIQFQCNLVKGKLISYFSIRKQNRSNIKLEKLSRETLGEDETPKKITPNKL